MVKDKPRKGDNTISPATANITIVGVLFAINPEDVLPSTDVVFNVGPGEAVQAVNIKLRGK